MYSLELAQTLHDDSTTRFGRAAAQHRSVVARRPSPRSSRRWRHRPDARIEVLGSLPGLASMPRRALADLARHAQEVEVPAGTVFTAHRQVLILAAGTARMSRRGPERAAVLGAGAVLAEPDGAVARPVMALTNLRLLVVGPADRSLFTALPAVARALAAPARVPVRATTAGAEDRVA
jgi:hypothetical protein